jgi:hypothetical protein
MVIINTPKDIEILSGNSVQVKNIASMLLDSERDEIEQYEWFEKNYIKSRNANTRGKIVATWRRWYFIAHSKGTGMYKRSEFKILPEEM